jgi:hypothetical protein
MRDQVLSRHPQLGSVRRTAVLFAAVVAGLLLQAGHRCRAGVPAPSPLRQPGVDSVRPIIDRMQDAQARLKRGDTSTETRTVQGHIVDDLQKLIDQAKRNSSRNQQQNNSQGQNNSRQQQSSPQPGRESDAASRPAAGLQAGTKGRVGKPRTTNSNPNVATFRPMWQAVWGHLPPTVRERVRNADFGETILPAYDDLVRRYFEALLDEPGGSSKQPAPQTGR